MRRMILLTVFLALLVGALFVFSRAMAPVATGWMEQGRVLSFFDQLAIGMAKSWSRWGIFVTEALVGGMLYAWIVYFRMRREADP